jgi:diadenosine tetraphosphate (Ap4A) HIT family hydrolase
LAENSSAIALLDSFPISPGHTLIVPKRHLSCFFDLSEKEQSDLWSLVAGVRSHLQKQHQPDGFNIGLNDGTAAGQTVMHAHIHIVPRYAGDVEDPRGGVRWLIPDKADYWSKD